VKDRFRFPVLTGIPTLLQITLAGSRIHPTFYDRPVQPIPCWQRVVHDTVLCCPQSCPRHSVMLSAELPTTQCYDVRRVAHDTVLRCPQICPRHCYVVRRVAHDTVLSCPQSCPRHSVILSAELPTTQCYVVRRVAHTVLCCPRRHLK
jgi:hypothetical protein